jgi:hypothetical protein
MVVEVAEKQLLEEIHQELVEELVEQEQILVRHFQEPLTVLHTVVVEVVEVEDHHLEPLEEQVVEVVVDHNQQDLEKLVLQTQVVEVVEL